MSLIWEDPDPTPITLVPIEPVVTGFDSCGEYVGGTTNFVSAATDLADQLAQIPDISVTLGPIDKVIRDIDLPDDPVEPSDLVASFPQPPDSIVYGGEVSLFTVPDVPEFTETDPVINLDIALPSPLDATLPAAPELTYVSVPDVPDVVIPDVPTLLSLEIPVLGDIGLPTFSATAPTAPSAPDPTMEWGESGYVSSVLSTLQEKLQAWVNGTSTGLDPDVEQAIWDRGRAREDALSQREITGIHQGIGSRGFRLPPGAILVAESEAIRKAQENSSTVSRDIMIKQAELEQDNRRHSIESALNMEGALLADYDRRMGRAFEARRLTATLAIDIFNAKVGLYNASVGAYQAAAAVFETELRAALSKLEEYRARLEGLRLLGELNTQQVEIYKARIAAVEQTVAVYREQVNAAKVTADTNQAIVAAHASLVSAYEAQTRAKSEEYRAYGLQVDAEARKIDIFRAKSDAYASRVAGYSSMVDAKKAVLDSEITVNRRLPIEEFSSQVEAYRNQVAGEASRLEALIGLLNSRVQTYGAKIGGLEARSRADVAEYSALSNLAINEGQLSLGQARANIDKLIAVATIVAENIRASGTLEAQIQAARLSQVNRNYSESLSHSTSESYSQSNSNSYSSSESLSQAQSRSDSVSVSYVYQL